MQKGLQCGSDAGCEVFGSRGTHLLSEHTPGGHNTLSAHSRTPPYTLGSTAPATQPQAARGRVLGKKLGSPPYHFTLLYQTIMDFLGLSPPCGPSGRTPGLSPSLFRGWKGRKRGWEGGPDANSFTPLPPPTRRSPQTLSTLKTWISLVTPPRTDTRPSCQVRTAVEVKGAGFLGMENLRRQDILYALKPGMVVHTCNNPSTWRCKQRTRNSRPVSNR